MISWSKILIVEIEQIIEEEILCRLFEFGHEIVKTVFNSGDALVYLQENDVDIVLIEMDMDEEIAGYELAEILKNQIKKPFIFVSPTIIQTNMERIKKAYPSAILISPSSLQQIHLSITIAINNFGTHDLPKLSSMKESSKLDLLNNCLFLKKKCHFERVNFSNIFWLKAENNYTVIHTIKGDFIYSTVLKNFTEKLPIEQFVRVHRSYIINLSKIEGFEGKMVIIDDERIPIAKNCQKKIFDLLHTV
jgi:DNA-binding LytR/AlgR family response regulator